MLATWKFDLLVEDETFGAKMEAMFEEDLANAREIGLAGNGRHRKVRPERPLGRKDRLRRGSPGSGPRALSRATQVGAAMVIWAGGDALNKHERAAGAAVGAGVLGASLLGTRFPRLLAWPLVTAGGLLGASALLRAARTGSPIGRTPTRRAGERMALGEGVWDRPRTKRLRGSSAGRRPVR